MAMIFTGVARITRDPELRTLPNGDPILQLGLAYNYGSKKDERGYLPTQFIDAGYFGKRAEAIAEYLEKGMVIQVTLSDVHIEQFKRADGTPGVKLACRVDRLDFIPGQREQGQDAPTERQTRAPAPAPAPSQRRAPAPAPRASSGFDDMDDDIPF